MYLNGDRIRSFIFSVGLLFDQLGSTHNTAEYEVCEIRCWNTTRNSYLLKEFMHVSLPLSYVQHYVLFYLPSLCNYGFSPSDSLNQNTILKALDVSLECLDTLELTEVTCVNGHCILQTQGIWCFEQNDAMGGRWLKEWLTGCEIHLYQKDEQYSCIVELLDECTYFEMQGTLIDDQIVLHTSTIFSYSTLEPDWITHLQLSICLATQEYKFTSKVIQEETSSLLPSSICLHKLLHSSILSVTSPTILTNCAPVKQWGMGLAVLRPEDVFSSHPTGFTKGCWVWDVLIRRCTTQYMGIGVAGLGSKSNSYLGRDFTGWSFQPTGEKWHSNVGSSYGPVRPSYGEGDQISVELDMNRGTLAFFKNNHYLGIAFTHLKENAVVAKYGLFPAFTSYRLGDEIEILGLREGVILDEYDDTEILSIKQNWKLGMRNGYGVIVYRNGEKHHGIWKNGICEGMMIYEKQNQFSYKWKSHNEITDASEEQIRSFFASYDNPVKLLQSVPPSSPNIESVLSQEVTLRGNVHSLPDSLFSFSTVNCAEGITLSNNNLTATCTMDNRCMVLGSRCFSSGKAYWEVKVENCEYGSIFIGIACKLVGSSHQCWRDFGFVNNRSFQDHAFESYYGTQFYKNDVIGVLVDFDVGELSFFKKGKEFYYSHHNCISFGMATRDLKTSSVSCWYYPSFGFKHKGDSVSLLHMQSVYSDLHEEEEILKWHYHLSFLSQAILAKQPECLPSCTLKLLMDQYHFIYKKNKAKIRVFNSIPVVIDCSYDESMISTVDVRKQIVGTRGNEVWYYDKNENDYWYSWNEQSAKRSEKENGDNDNDECVPMKAVLDYKNLMEIKKKLQVICEEKGVSFELFTLMNQDLCMEGMTSVEVGIAITLLQLINHVGQTILSLNSPLIPLLFYSTKKHYFYKVLSLCSFFNNRGNDEMDRPLTIPEIRINRVAIQKAQAAGVPQADLVSLSILSQLIKAMECLPLSNFRRDFSHAEDAGQSRCFFVRLVGEGVYDSGGPYREILNTCLSTESMSVFGMTKETANCENGLSHDDMREWVNPHEMKIMDGIRYQFYWGVLLGIAIRDHITLSLPFVMAFFKGLVHQGLDKEDLIESDISLVRFIDNWNESIATVGSLEDLLNQLPIDEETRELLLQSAFQHTVDPKTLLIQVLLHKKQEDCSYVMRGVFYILPQSLCSLFSPQEMKVIVCGQAVVTTESLKSIVEYSEGVDENHRTIQRFWRVVEGLTSKERSQLLVFVTARSSIPSPPHPSISFKIVLINGNDSVLPQSQTCFSILKLPQYSSDMIMKKQLQYSIQNTPTMELDVQLHEAEGWD